jgi:hypothetical protein
LVVAVVAVACCAEHARGSASGCTARVSIRRGWGSPGKVWGASAGVWLRSRTGAGCAQRTLDGR